jgi:hypothetical protein
VHGVIGSLENSTMYSRLNDSNIHWRYRPLPADITEAIAAAERGARESIEASFSAIASSIERSLRKEIQYFLEEQIAMIQLAEPRRRKQIEMAERSEQGLLQKFFSAKTGSSLLLALDMNHRRIAAWCWLKEALVRRELETRFVLCMDRLEWLQDVKKLRPRFEGTSPSPTRIDKRPGFRSKELAWLYEERGRGLFAAFVRELEFTHGVERSRIEWAEELDRQHLERAIGRY